MTTLMTFEQVMLELAVPHGTVEGWDKRRSWGVTAAALIDLETADRVNLTAAGKDLYVTRVNSDSTGVAPLDQVLHDLTDSSKLRDILKRQGDTIEHEAAASMKGLISVQRRSFLGLFPKRYRIHDAAAKSAVDAQLAETLRGGRADPQALAVIAILDGLRVLNQVLPEAGRWRKQHDIEQPGTESAVFRTLRNEVGHIGTFIPGFGAS